MNYPSVPTDNLYKFLAIFGLLIFIASFVYPYHLNKELKNHIFDTEELIEAVGAEQRTTSLESKSWSHLLEKLLSILEENEPGKERDKFSWKDYKVLLEANHKINEHVEEDRKRVATLGKSSKIAEYLLKELEKLASWVLVGRWVGLSFIFIGFGLWYWKLQRHQDRIIFNEARGQDITQD